MKKPHRILIAFTLLCLSLPAAAQIGASLDRDEIGPGETVQLTLQHNGQTDSQPDLSPLKQDFEILGQSSGSSIQIINGKVNSQEQIQLTLMPKHSGKLHIPALQWDGQASAFLPLTVDASAAAAHSGNAPAGNANAARVFVTSTPGQKQPYVQAAVPLTVRLYTDQPIYQASLDLQSSNDVLVQQAGKDTQTSETRNGRSYQVIERKYLLFPQRSGHLQLAGPVLNAQVQDNSSNSGNNDPFGNSQIFSNIFGRNPFAGMMNTTRPIRVQGNPITLNVRPRPASAGGHDWLPAQQVTLTETWQPDQDTIHAGAPITLHLHLSAEGLTAEQLPDLSRQIQLPDGLRAYPDQPRLNTDTSGNSVVGTRDQDIAVIADTPGRYEIPALHLFWWDTTSNTQREIDLPARALNVLPGAGGVAVNPAPPPQARDTGSIPPQPLLSVPQHDENAMNNSRWSWVSAVFAALWLGTLAAWWRSSRRVPAKSSGLNAAPAAPQHASEARKAFQQACRDNDPLRARRNLLDWADATWPDNPPSGLRSLAARLEDAALEPLLGQLDRACYTGSGWNGEALLDALKTLKNEKKTMVPSEPELSPLYP